MDNRAVGVMDSGVGGLTVARVLAEKYPKEGIVFLGIRQIPTGNVP